MLNNLQWSTDLDESVKIVLLLHIWKMKKKSVFINKLQKTKPVKSFLTGKKQIGVILHSKTHRRRFRGGEAVGV